MGHEGDDLSQKPRPPFDGTVDAQKVARRAEGRPPEERSSSDPDAQAEAILEDSEDRIATGEARSEPRSR